MSSQYREGHRDGVNDANHGIDATLEVQQACRDEGGDPEVCDYCRGYSGGQGEVPTTDLVETVRLSCGCLSVNGQGHLPYKGQACGLANSK